MKLRFWLIGFVIGTLSLEAQVNHLNPVPFTRVKLNDAFWAPRIQTNHEVTIPISIQKSRETGRIQNFVVAARLAPGSFCSKYPFDDSDVFKIIEGASYSLQLFPDTRLEATLDTLIHYIALAQEPDGYLYTNRTIDSNNLHPWVSRKRWENDPILSHELYNVGHLYEAAVAHYQATGKRTLLDVAIKNADLVARDFLDRGLKFYPGHQEIELALVKLYRVTGNERYLQLAKYFLDIRKGGEVYNQAHKPVVEQDEIIGHAVRATYMYCGMADVAALTGEKAYQDAIRRIWNDMIRGKYYITGGIGSDASNEGFGPAYHLPNETAYCETCASIGNVLWNYRMFLMDADARYLDVAERTLYNALLSGVSLSGDRFFYPNPLESNGQHKRAEWFGCACCPSNICRFLPSLPGFFYAYNADRLYVNFYAGGTANPLDGVVIETFTHYPWEGNIAMVLKEVRGMPGRLALRIPGWARGEAVPSDLYRFTNRKPSEICIAVNGQAVNYTMEKGFAIIQRDWQPGDRIDLTLSMPVKFVVAHPEVKEDSGKVALQRGPLVYCLEWPDQLVEETDATELDSLANLWDISLMKIDTSAAIQVRPFEGLLPGTLVLEGKAFVTGSGKKEWSEVHFRAIPYFEWANRGPGRMRVWLPVADRKL
ncbi:MAG: glycoside hydrolase family 127 protein [Bacteroidales bacterium]